MKKICLFLTLIIMILTGYIVYLLKASLNEDEIELIKFESRKEYVLTKAGKKDVVNEKIYDGIVSGKEAILSKKVEFWNEYSVKAQVGQVVTPGSTVVQIDNGKEISFPETIRIINYDEEYFEGNRKVLVVTYLDYSKLFIETSFDLSDDTIYTYDANYKMTCDDKELENVSLIEKGCVCNSGLIEAKFKTDSLLLPGTQVKVHLILGVLENQWCLPNEYVYENEEGTYALILSGDNEIKIPVVVVCKTETESAIKFDTKYAEGMFIGEYNRNKSVK